MKKAGIIDKYIGYKIKTKREEIGLSQKQLGNFLHITFQQIQKNEKGETRIPATRLYKISKIFNVKMNYFFKDLDVILKKNINKTNIQYKKSSKYDKNLQKDLYQINKFFKQIEDKKTRKIIIKIVGFFTDQ